MNLVRHGIGTTFETNDATSAFSNLIPFSKWFQTNGFKRRATAKVEFNSRI